MWNMHVPMAVNVLCIATKVQTFVHTMNEMDPVSIQTQLKQRTGFIDDLMTKFAPMGEHKLYTMCMLK